MADDIITSLEIIEKLLFPETDFWRNNYLKDMNEPVQCTADQINKISFPQDFSIIMHFLTETLGRSKGHSSGWL